MPGCGFFRSAMRRWCVSLVALSSTPLACQAFLDTTDSRVDASAPDASGAVADASEPHDGAPDASRADGGPDDAMTSNPCPPPGDAEACPDAALGAVRWKGRCYFVPVGLHRHGELGAVCSNAGAYPATFTCDEEWGAARGLVSDITFLGGSRTNDASPWRWQTSETWGFEAWAPDQPAGGFHCARAAEDGLWHAAGCAGSAYGLCEVGPYAP